MCCAKASNPFWNTPPLLPAPDATTASAGAVRARTAFFTPSSPKRRLLLGVQLPEVPALGGEPAWDVPV